MISRFIAHAPEEVLEITVITESFEGHVLLKETPASQPMR